jgi:hypothetical protein
MLPSVGGSDASRSPHATVEDASNVLFTWQGQGHGALRGALERKIDELFPDGDEHMAYVQSRGSEAPINGERSTLRSSFTHVYFTTGELNVSSNETSH